MGQGRYSALSLALPSASCHAFAPSALELLHIANAAQQRRASACSTSGRVRDSGACWRPPRLCEIKPFRRRRSACSVAAARPSSRSLFFSSQKWPQGWCGPGVSVGVSGGIQCAAQLCSCHHDFASSTATAGAPINLSWAIGAQHVVAPVKRDEINVLGQSENTLPFLRCNP